jgi:hypothetical protein
MASFDDLGTIANNVGFRQRCLIAAYVQAVYTMNNVSNPAANVISFCQQVLNGAVSGTEFALVAVANPTIAAEANVSTTPDYAIADTDIQSALSEAWNAMAGVPAN